MDLSIYNKIMIACTTILGVGMFMSLLAMRITLNAYDEKLYGNSVAELAYFSERIQDEIGDLEASSLKIAMDKEVQSQLVLMKDTEDKQVFLQGMTILKNKMVVESLVNNFIVDVHYINDNNVSFNIGSKVIQLPATIYKEFLKKATSANGGFVFLEPSNSFPYLVVGRNIHERFDQSLEYLGTLLFVCDLGKIVEINRNILKGEKNEIFILSDMKMIFATNKAIFKWPKMNGLSGYKIVKDGKRYFVAYLNSENYPWTYVNAFEYNSIYSLNFLVSQMLIIGFFMLFILSVFILWRITRFITSPLENLANSMKIVEKGRFEEAKEILISPGSNDEVGVLFTDFTIMLDKITILVRENYEKQITLMETSLKALQAQINPHFMHNTLNSIGWTMKAGRQEEAQEMIVSLGQLLHSAFKKTPMGSIADEIDILDRYIYIQKIRYCDRVKFIYDIDSDILNEQIPRLILQPLIENAISYGVERSLEVCTINVVIKSLGREIMIIVSDNGKGMDEKKLETIRNQQGKLIGMGIGISNIKERLLLIYRDQFQFAIQSETNIGTKIEIIVPKKGEEENVENGGY